VLTRFCLVRHGETPWNAELRLQGHIDVPLNDTGRRQAAATAHVLSAHRFDALYSSDLTRALQTAAAAASACGLQPLPHSGLRERHYGVLQGRTYDEAEAQHPEVWRHFKGRNPAYSFPGGGESLAEFDARVRQAMDAILRAHTGQTVLVVTHGGVLDIIHRLASGKPLEAARDFAIPNAALNWIAHDAQGWRLECWADQTHLGSSMDELPHP